ncbi:MAG: hypothetical protein GXP33_10945 [Spirochaetes bacterium]|nr:hypothetical protein [Spirochaetota bacterium]
MDRNTIKSDDGFIELVFGPRWKYISCVRSFVQNFLAISLTDLSKVDKIAMAASELLENAVKYSREERIKINIMVSKELKRVDVYVENKTSAESIEILKKEYEKIMEGTALEAYIKKMREAGLRNDGKSQLGIARIRYETGGRLMLETEDNTVKIKLCVDF